MAFITIKFFFIRAFLIRFSKDLGVKMSIMFQPKPHNAVLSAAMTLFSYVTLSSISAFLTIVYTGLLIYFLIKDRRDASKH